MDDWSLTTWSESIWESGSYLAARTTKIGKAKKYSYARIRWATRSIRAIRGTKLPYRGHRSVTWEANTPGLCRRDGTTERTILLSILAAVRWRGYGRQL